MRCVGNWLGCFCCLVLPFAAPFVDLAPTILRSQVLCSLLFAAIAVAGTALVSRISPVAGGSKCVISLGDRFFLHSNLLALNCSRLC
jgi:hypothetical protein